MEAKKWGGMQFKKLITEKLKILLNKWFSESDKRKTRHS